MNELEIKTSEEIHRDAEHLKKKWVSADSLKDFLTLLESTPHYNRDDAVQQFMLDIKKEIKR